MIMQLRFCNGFVTWLNDVWYRLKRLFHINRRLKVRENLKFNDLVEEEDYYLSLSLKEKTEKTDNSK